MVSGIVDGDKCGGLDDGCLECLHGLLMFFLPFKGGTFASQVDERVGD